MIVAIHQPNFFPWLGYFDKIRRADVFIMLDSVQQAKTGGTWSNRVMLLVAGQPRWITAPVERNFSGVRSVRDIRFESSVDWRRKLLRTIDANYARAPHYRETLDLIQPLVENGEPYMALYNRRAIEALMAAMGLEKTRLVQSSSLEAGGGGTELLVGLIRAVGGRTYLAGGGAAGYQVDADFSKAGIELVHQDFKHPCYAQCGAAQFVPGLSIIDALMNCGIQGTARLIHGKAAS